MGKSQGDQTVTNKTELPSWYTGPAKAMMDQAQAAAANIARPYQGNTVAGLDPMTQQAVSYTGANMGSTNPAYAQAGQTAANVAGYTPGSFLTGNIGAYMNPYIQNVEQAALGNMDNAYRQNLNTIGDRAINANAFGGSRQGVAEGVAASENARQMGDLSAQLRAQGYGQAGTMMQSDMDRSMRGQELNLNAATTQGNLATGGQAAYLQGLQSAVAAGQINQEQAQQLLNQNVSRYDAMSNIPANQLNLMLAALGGTQVPTTSTQKTPTSGNWLTGAAGGALAGASMGPWGMLGGGILGGIAGA
jgi:hypothetical protein